MSYSELAGRVWLARAWPLGGLARIACRQAADAVTNPED